MKSKTIQLDEHEAVVDRDWLGEIGKLLVEAGHKEIGEECIAIGNKHGDQEDD